MDTKYSALLGLHDDEGQILVYWDKGWECWLLPWMRQSPASAIEEAPAQWKRDGLIMPDDEWRSYHRFSEVKGCPEHGDEPREYEYRMYEYWPAELAARVCHVGEWDGEDGTRWAWRRLEDLLHDPRIRHINGNVLRHLHRCPVVY